MTNTMIDIADSEMIDIANFAVEYWRQKQQRRSQDNMDAFDEDQRLMHTIVGKMGEYAAWKLVGTTAPDMTIYPPGHPTIADAPDLTTSCQQGLHVKTASTMEEDTWLARSSDRIVAAPSPTDVIVL